MHSNRKNKSRAKDEYIGSVRFFKHVFITIFILIITVPTIVAIICSVKASESKAELSQLQQDMEMLIEEQETQEETEQVVETLTIGSEEIETEGIWYQSLYPEMYTDYPEEFIIAEEQTVYLTFDDGPSSVTDEVLEVLDAYGVKATFFVVGSNLESSENAERLKKIVESGHSVGIHTYSHSYSEIYASVDAYLEDFYRTWELIVEITGVEPTIFRFPGGSINAYNGTIYQEIISEMTRRGFVYYDWNLSAGDDTLGTSSLDTETIVNNATRNLGYHSIFLLFNDSGSKSTSVQALPEVIEYYLESGYSIEPLTNDIAPVIFNY